ncbi:bacterio-opsin activator domain-containing protein [Halorussus litoreus]|uniref:bacterio-opsin activator domain-containing protein n=1 Tax=Halorussus litoreus TaxID=1710536 RepID=UPI000E28110A|nr:bacterio-opsin activator domain-containing protein [Halorussus litoreus]
MTSEQKIGSGASETDGSAVEPTALRVLYVDGADPPPALSAADGVSVSMVPTAAAARERLATPGPIDCVVSEYDLPESDGIALLEAVRDDHPNLPFVLYTGSGNEAVASEAVGKGVTDYLPKEFGGERLRERVDRAVAATSVEAESGVTGERLRELTTAFPDVAFLVDATGRYLEVLSGPDAGDLETVEQERLVGKRFHDAFPDEKADRFLDHVRTTLETGAVETIEYRVETTDGGRWYEGRTAPLGDSIGGREAVVWVARDVTERRRDRRELAESRDELTRLTRINGLIYTIVGSLVGSASREEIERTVCEGLANSEFYQFAWIGGSWVSDERTNPSVVEGVDRAAVERLVQATSTRCGTENSFARVVAEDESVVVRDVADDDEILSDRERDIMLDIGMCSAVLVPLSYGTTNYGVLGISGEHPGTFSERELTALETLGGLVSFAIDAVKNRNLLLSDTAVELEFRVASGRSRFARLSAELDARFQLEGVVPVSDDRLLEYVTVEGASAETVADRLGDGGHSEAAKGNAVEAEEAIEGANHRIVTEDDVSLLEIELASSAVNKLLKAGAVVKSAEATDGVVRYVAEASADANVRSIVDTFRTAFPDSELVGKQEVDRPVHTATEFRRTLDADLTDKQRTALQTAYFGGYYEYPRTSTGEEVADSLGVSSPTLHQHLRAAQRKLVRTYLDQ